MPAIGVAGTAVDDKNPAMPHIEQTSGRVGVPAGPPSIEAVRSDELVNQIANSGPEGRRRKSSSSEQET
jgi:hypothetical protein